MHTSRHWIWILALLLAGALARAQVALPPTVFTLPGPHVVVNGTRIDAPVRKLNGSLVLPMRAVFEALGAEVRWFPATQEITATRGTTVVKLTLNRKTAFINEKQVTLVVAPLLMEGATYVPLRFPAEAFGGEVTWYGDLETASIALAPLGGTPPPEPAPDPAPNPDPNPNPNPDPAPSVQSAGLLIGKSPDAGNTLLVRAGEKDELIAVPLAESPTIARGALGTLPQPATFTQLLPGDQLAITRNEAGKAIAVTATYAEVRGTVAALAANKLLMQDGALFELHPEVRVYDQAGKAAVIGAVKNGAAVTLESPPNSTVVWRLRLADAAGPAPDPAPTPDPPAPIISVIAPGYTRPLRAGETLTLQVIGTPHAKRVTVRVGEVIAPVTLTQQEPGRYLGKVKVPAKVNGRDLPLLAVMQVGDVTTPEVRGQQAVTLDTVAPRFLTVAPIAQTAQTADPVIEATFNDPDGSGIRPTATTVRVNGTDVTKQATLTAGTLTYRPTALAAGPVTVSVQIADLAGNTAKAEWQFTLAAAPPALAESTLTHSATGTVPPGRRLTLTATLKVAPVALEWYVGDKRISKELGAVPNAPGTYRIEYVIAADVPAGAHPVTLRVFTAPAQSVVLTAATPVTVSALPQALAITSPANKSVAPDALKVAGAAKPGSRVRVTVSYVSKKLGFASVTGELYRDILTANAYGRWTTPEIQTKVALINVESYTVTAEVLDKDDKVLDKKSIALQAK